MSNFFVDYLVHHIGGSERMNLIAAIYDAVGGKDVIGDDIFKTGLHLPQEIIIHLLTYLNKIIWDGVKFKLTNKKLIDYADDQINYFTPSINLGTCRFKLNNIADNVYGDLADHNITNKELMSYVIDNIVAKLQKGDV